MGANITYILDKHYGDPEKYNKKIKDFVKTLGVDIDAKNFNLKCKPTEDYGGIFVDCFMVEHYTKKGYENLTFNNTIFYFSLVEMPGCCAYLISTGTYVGRDFQGKGIAQFLQELKYEMAKDAKYPYLFATTIADNKIENHILEKFGWINIDEITNTRTCNKIKMWKKEIRRK